MRGRSGRQGDPGLSRFYLCLEDDLLRIFGPDTLFSKMMKSNLADGEAIGSKWLSKAIETAQKKVEARNYDMRKQVVQYDDVMNDQRKVVYEQRAEIMDSPRPWTTWWSICATTRSTQSSARLARRARTPNSGTWKGLKAKVEDIFGLQPPFDEWLAEDQVEPELLEERLRTLTDAMTEEKMAANAATWRIVEKDVLLRQLDYHWKEHLADAGCVAAGDLDAFDSRRSSRSTNTSRKPSACSNPCSIPCVRK